MWWLGRNYLERERAKESFDNFKRSLSPYAIALSELFRQPDIHLDILWLLEIIERRSSDRKVHREITNAELKWKLWKPQRCSCDESSWWQSRGRFMVGRCTENLKQFWDSVSFTNFFANCITIPTSHLTSSGCEWSLERVWTNKKLINLSSSYLRFRHSSCSSSWFSPNRTETLAASQASQEISVR